MGLVMDINQHLLGKLSEEAAELGKAAIKAQLFGLDVVHPTGTVTNRDDIAEELDGLKAVVELLQQDLNYEPDSARISKKKSDIMNYILVSAKLNKTNLTQIEERILEP